MLRSALLAASRSAQVRTVVEKFPPTQALVKRFVAGDLLEQGIDATAELVASGRKVTLDHLGEDTLDATQAAGTAEAYEHLLAALKDQGLADTTDVILTSDHGFSTISKESATSFAATQSYKGVPSRQLPPGFVAIDIAHALGLTLFDPDAKGAKLEADKFPSRANGLIGTDPAKPDVVVAANGGSRPARRPPLQLPRPCRRHDRHPLPPGARDAPAREGGRSLHGSAGQRRCRGGAAGHGPGHRSVQARERALTEAAGSCQRAGLDRYPRPIGASA